MPPYIPVSTQVVYFIQTQQRAQVLKHHGYLGLSGELEIWRPALRRKLSINKGSSLSLSHIPTKATPAAGKLGDQERH